MSSSHTATHSIGVSLTSAPTPFIPSKLSASDPTHSTLDSNSSSSSMSGSAATFSINSTNSSTNTGSISSWTKMSSNRRQSNSKDDLSPDRKDQMNYDADGDGDDADGDGDGDMVDEEVDESSDIGGMVGDGDVDGDGESALGHMKTLKSARIRRRRLSELADHEIWRCPYENCNKAFSKLSRSAISEHKKFMHKEFRLRKNSRLIPAKKLKKLKARAAAQEDKRRMMMAGEGYASQSSSSDADSSDEESSSPIRNSMSGGQTMHRSTKRSRSPAGASTLGVGKTSRHRVSDPSILLLAQAAEQADPRKHLQEQHMREQEEQAAMYTAYEMNRVAAVSPHMHPAAIYSSQYPYPQQQQPHHPSHSHAHSMPNALAHTHNHNHTHTTPHAHAHAQSANTAMHTTSGYSPGLNLSINPYPSSYSHLPPPHTHAGGTPVYGESNSGSAAPLYATTQFPSRRIAVQMPNSARSAQDDLQLSSRSQSSVGTPSHSSGAPLPLSSMSSTCSSSASSARRLSSSCYSSLAGGSSDSDDNESVDMPLPALAMTPVQSMAIMRANSVMNGQHANVNNSQHTPHPVPQPQQDRFNEFLHQQAVLQQQQQQQQAQAQPSAVNQAYYAHQHSASNPALFNSLFQPTAPSTVPLHYHQPQHPSHGPSHPHRAFLEDDTMTKIAAANDLQFVQQGYNLQSHSQAQTHSPAPYSSAAINQTSPLAASPATLSSARMSAPTSQAFVSAQQALVPNAFPNHSHRTSLPNNGVYSTPAKLLQHGARVNAVY